ncbi:MAG: aryl-sulfate sulfotransferase [Candidatus Eisenbacteria bacterium]|nr:aryl-sulfate sulfotransferase [Candidatus Eisenbacteria bacterium]
MTLHRNHYAWVVLSIGCTLAGGSPEAAAGGQAPSPEELERLRSLPYAGSARPGTPDLDGVTIHDRVQAQPGVNLYTIQKASTAELIDADGRVLRSWRQEPAFTWERADLLPSGDLIVVGADPPDDARVGIPDDKRFVAKYDWDGRLLWKRYLRAHHDIEQTPSGMLLVLTFERKQLRKYHRKVDTRDDLLTLLDQNGAVVDSVSLLEVFSRSPGVEMAAAGVNSHGVRPWLDLFHANSVEWMYQPELAARDPRYGPDNVLVCMRHQNRVAIINWPERRIVWTWGPGELLGPHDAQVLANGNVLIFDNGLGRRWSRAVEVDPTSDRIVWEYRAPEPTDFYTLSKGSCQRLANGNTLLANSDNGKAFEVTPAGTIVWSFATPHRDSSGDRLAIVRIRRLDTAIVEEFSRGR